MASEYEVKNFEDEVVDGSRVKPVMVDFWAPWCEPCLMLEPIITEIANENQDRVRLVKVNVDENQELAERYNIRGIPAIRIFHNGDVVAAFNGLMYKGDFERWLRDNLPDDNRARLIHIKELIDAGKDREVRTALEELVQHAPHMLEARVLLAAYYILDQPHEAARMVTDVEPSSPFFAVADAVRVVDELNNIYENQDGLEEADGKAELLEAILFIRNKEIEPALENLMTVVTRNKDYHNGIAQRAMIALFTILGNSHPLTKDYRSRYEKVIV